MAIEYCYRFRELNPDRHVFWVYANSFARIAIALRDIARLLSLPGWNNPNIDGLKLVYEWLMDTSNSRWLLVLDGADDIETIFGSPSDSPQGRQIPPLVRYLPQTSHGSILITTRDKTVARSLIDGDDPVQVPPMVFDEAKQLLISRISNHTWHEADLMRILSDLECLPLAIIQAAAFITQNEITVEEYLQALQLNNAEMNSFLSQEMHDLRIDEGTVRSVFRTWKLTFDQIARRNPRAAELLSLMAVLDRQGIPDTLLHVEGELKIDFIAAIGTLKAFSIISEEKDGLIYGLHLLTQLATLQWLGLNNVVERFQKQALENVCQQIPPFPHECFAEWRIIYPHAQAVLRYDLESDYHLILKMMISCCTALYDSFRGLENHSLTLFENTFFESVEPLEPQHFLQSLQFVSPSNQLSSRSSLVKGMKTVMGDRELFRRGMSVFRDLFPNARMFHIEEELVFPHAPLRRGQNHLPALMTEFKRGHFYRKQGRHSKAQDTSEKALARAEKLTEPLTFVGTLLTLAFKLFLANVHGTQGHFAEAEAGFKSCVPVCEKLFSPVGNATLVVIEEIASAARKQGKLAEAEAIYLDGIARHETTALEDTSVVAITANNLGCVYLEQERYDEAENWFRRALKAKQRLLGPDHEETGNSMGNLSDVMRFQGRYAEAEDLARQYLALNERRLGVNHIETIWAVDNLGVLSCLQEKFDESVKFFERALGGFRKAMGPQHLNVLVTARTLAPLYEGQSKNKESENMYRLVADGYQKSSGPQHESTLAALLDLAQFYARQLNHEEAIRVFLQLLSTHEKMLGLQNPKTFAMAFSFSVCIAHECQRQLQYGGDISTLSRHRDAPYYFNQLTAVVQKHGARVRSLFGFLGRILMWLNDEANARVAFEQELGLNDDNWEYSAFCDGCERQLVLRTHRFVCKQCVDIDLCQECLDGHCQGIKQMDTCVDHQFLKLSIEASADIDEFQPMTSEEQCRWIKKIRVDHGSRNFLRVLPALRWLLHSRVDFPVLAGYVAVIAFTGLLCAITYGRYRPVFSAWPRA